MKVTGLAVSLALCAIVIGSALYAAPSFRCQPVTDCSETASCTWMDRTFPAENVCVNIVLHTPDECKSWQQYGWDCTDHTTTQRCAKRYWNYIGRWGDSSNCTTGTPPTYGPYCGEEDFQYDTGRFVPDSCTETSP